MGILGDNFKYTFNIGKIDLCKYIYIYIYLDMNALQSQGAIELAKNMQYVPNLKFLDLGILLSYIYHN